MTKQAETRSNKTQISIINPNGKSNKSNDQNVFHSYYPNLKKHVTLM